MVIISLNVPFLSRSKSIFYFFLISVGILSTGFFYDFFCLERGVHESEKRQSLPEKSETNPEMVEFAGKHKTT
jgi:hypothetical protein